MINDILVSPYHLQFDEVAEKAGKFIESVYAFQFEEFNSSWIFNSSPHFDRYTMGRGSGMISFEKITYDNTLSQPHISLYDTNANLIYEFYVDHRCSSSISQSFSDDSIAVLTDDGFYFYYSNRQLKKEINLKDILKIGINVFVMDACFWEGGVVILFTNGDLFSYDLSGHSTKLKHFNDMVKPQNFLIVPPNKSPTGKLITYLLVHQEDDQKKESAIFAVSENYFYTIRLEKLITHIAMSANYQKIAVLCKDLSIRVWTIDLQKEEFEKDVESNGHLYVVNLCWVGDVAPVVCFQGAFTLVTLDPEGMPMWALDNKSNFTFGFTDADSCIVITPEMTYRIRYVPRQIYYIFSQSLRKPHIPPVYIDEFDDSDDNEQSDNNDKWNTAKLICEAFINRFEEPPLNKLGSIGTTDVLIKAAHTCLKAAEYFFNYDVQDFFLNAACFTFTYMNGQTSAMHDSLIRIKILNLIRKFTNLNITIPQIYDIGIDNLITRLMTRNMNVSIDIAKTLRMPTIEIQKDSINKTITNNQNDEACFSLVVEIIQSENNDKSASSSQLNLFSNCLMNTTNLNSNIVADYSYAAMCAIRNGRKELANKFCNLEPNFALKAKIFAKLGEWDQALNHAEASCDSSSLFIVMKHMMKIIMEPDCTLINKTIAKYDFAAMFVARNRDYIGKDRAETILDFVDPRCSFSDAKERLMINFEGENNNSSETNSSDGKKRPKKDQKILDTQIILKKCQTELAVKYNDYTFNGLTFNDTIRKFFNMPSTDASQKEAFDLAEKCGIPAVNVATIAIRCFALNKKWSELKRFTLNKNFKSLWPLVMATAIAHGNDQFASEFAHEVNSSFNDGSLLEQYESKYYIMDNFKNVPSYQKYFFRKQNAIMSFFKI